MESATELLFSQANKSAESFKETSEEMAKDIPKVEESKEMPKESKENISSIETGINLISINTKELKEEENSKDNDDDINLDSPKNDFFFPIINNKPSEESKNSISEIPSTLNKFSQESPLMDFSSINLKIPNNIKSKDNNILIDNTLLSPKDINQDNSSGLNQYIVPNFFLTPNPINQSFFGNKFIQNFNNSASFVPVSLSCSLDTHKKGKSKGNTKQEEKEFFEKIIKIADVNNISEFWEVFQHIKKPSQCPFGTDYHVFKRGIIPMWEDDMNKNGGKLSVLLTWKFVNVIWEEVTFNFAKGLLPQYEYINGIVISMRPKFVVLSFWIRTNVSSIVEKLRNALSIMIQAPSPNCMDFIPFN